MQSQVTIGDNFDARLEKAILIYTVNGDSGNSNCCATVHEIMATNGAPLLAAGTPITSSFLRQLNEQLEGKQKRGAGEFLPENVLARTASGIVWWTPAKKRSMYFGGAAREQDGLEGLSGAVFPHPALLWVVSNARLRVRALGGNCRPVVDGGCMVAPYWNAGSEGEICQGTMRSPKNALVSGIGKWESAFFESRFTHANHNRLTSHPGGFLGLWKEVAGKESFPARYLISVPGETVGSVIKGI